MHSETGPGFKPLVMATNKRKSMYLLASENSLQSSLIDLKFKDVLPGQLIKLSDADGLEIIETLDYSNLMMDPFEFVPGIKCRSNNQRQEHLSSQEKHWQGTSQLCVQMVRY